MREDYGKIRQGRPPGKEIREENIHMNKRILSIICILTLCLGLLPAGALAVDPHVSLNALSYNVGENNTLTITDCSEGARGDLDIPETIDGYTVTAIGAEAFRNCRQITNINMPNTVTAIESRAFMECDSLAEMVIPDSVTKLGDSICRYCDNLQRVVVGRGAAKVAEYDFASCPKLNDVNLSDGLIEIGPYAFMESTSLEEVVIPDSVTSLDRGAFERCSKLKTATVGGGIKTLPRSTFDYCSALETIIIREGVQRIEKFLNYGSSKLKTLYLPSSLVEIEAGCFKDCTDISEIYYNGSAYGWGGVAIGLGNDPILSEELTVHYVPFTDTQPGEYYYTPMTWAIDKGITNGTSDTTFSPYNTCTQGQILTFLYRAAGSPQVSVSNDYTNESITPGKYYYNAMLWAYSEGIVTDKDLDPEAPCLRSDVVTYLWRFNDEPTAGSASFEDVPESAAYYQAVAWAVDKGITDGTGATTFSPDDTCTRAQIVTFLYRAFN